MKSKSQQVRLIDIFIISPILYYIAVKKGKLTDLDRYFLGGLAFFTLIYNYNNYRLNNATS
jgi:hypothetical protein